MVLLASSVFSQNVAVVMATTQTLTNSDTADLTLTVSGVYRTTSIQAVVTKYSGTVTGTGIIQGSIDGTNYLDINTDTLTLANQTTNTKVWVLEGSMFKYYRLRIITTGTSSVQAKGYVFTTGQGGAKHAVQNMLSDINLTSDTATNSGSAYVELRVQGDYKSIAIQAVATKISGTNGGTVTLQGSNDGTNFVTVDVSYLYDMATSAPYTTGGAATLTVLNQTTTSKIFVINGSPYSYYRLSHTGTGTMVSRLRGYMMPNR
jgi:hypothetical protein